MKTDKLTRPTLSSISLALTLSATVCGMMIAWRTPENTATGHNHEHNNWLVGATIFTALDLFVNAVNFTSKRNVETAVYESFATGLWTASLTANPQNGERATIYAGIATCMMFYLTIQNAVRFTCQQLQRSEPPLTTGNVTNSSAMYPSIKEAKGPAETTANNAFTA